MTVQSAQPAQSRQSAQAAEPDVIYTWTDEAPMLATHSFLPIVRGFAQRAGVSVGTADISLAGRILAAFSLADDDLARLGELTQSPTATIIKLPNISASLPQLKAAIAELQALGYEVPDYPDAPATPAEREARAAYDAVKGSAVNPVLREGNSDRRAPAAVKAYARSHPHSMGAWSPESRTRVATMEAGDFRHNERSVVVPEAGTLQIRLRPADGAAPVILRESLPVSAGEVVDATFMSAAALDEFLARQVAAAKDEDLLLSVHLKATMMKVSDPLIFGHAVRAALPGVFATYGEALAEAGLRAEDGLASILAGLEALPQGEQIRAAIEAELAAGPRLSMVDSDRGITNLHVPSDVIIDASMPAMIRGGGHLWGPDGRTADTIAVIPDSSYAGVYQAVIDDCRTHGALDPATMGSVPNVGLMARKAEEYGSHDKTFLVPADGTVEVVVTEGAGAEPGTVLLSHEVEAGDIWRACTTQDAPVRDWVHLAVTRARATGAPAVFWLDPERGHDAVLIDLVRRYLAEEDTEGLDIRVLDPMAATRLSLERARRGEDTISVTGNVLRDYNTDLFPILEVGTSAKMLSVVPLMNGGGLYETGAGGSAPKHVRQLLEEDYLRWDSLGEFLALAEALHHVAQVSGNDRAEVLADALEAATTRLLEDNRSPARRLGQVDNRGSHAWLALYWAGELAAQETSPELAAVFAPIAQQLEAFNDTIQAELLAVQGSPVDIGGYYRPDAALTDAVMRPSTTLNAVVEALV
ncbi:NADP-dependent isocitrate dehydrogenase [Actinomyces viscosus]|uniref:Isocitrate dehydrogenase [NADP] n=1 Tax=Actinomyces viscosus TaxID=1656 RepID=A0A3S4Z8P0_ACTVI|nr:NADP-dependent isocitrate dehydrogenase [Actinomyces viscosus]TFH52149.1 NADP-dependent isocitrate dehydrogenase [Actinomyces viscosus]VEI15919.1 Isocitrate dehydrogenase [NADP] [Actinomyces viscosus]